MEEVIRFTESHPGIGGESKEYLWRSLSSKPGLTEVSIIGKNAAAGISEQDHDVRLYLTPEDVARLVE
jgi:hypothetical protein